MQDRKSKCIIVAIVLIALFVLLCGCSTLLFYLASQGSSSDNSSEQGDGKTVTDPNFDNGENIPDQFGENLEDSFGPESIYNDDVPETEIAPITVNDITILVLALRALDEKGWDGESTPLPISYKDMGESKLRAIAEDEQSKEGRHQIPDKYVKYFDSKESQTEIKKEIFKAYDEYIQYLKIKGIHEAYLKEIQTNTLPRDPDRFFYYGNNNLEDPPSSVSGLPDSKGNVADYSKRIMKISDIYLFNAFEFIVASRILGEIPSDEKGADAYYEKARNIAVRRDVYHEMTHITQRAYATLHTPEDDRKDKSYTISATKTLADVDTQYFWKWSDFDVFTNLHNHTVSEESQAEGIMFDALTTSYDMSENQKKAFWRHYFSRLDIAKAELDESKELFDTKFPKVERNEIQSDINKVTAQFPDSSINYTLGKLILGQPLPNHVGYLHPMRPEDTSKFWNALKVAPEN